MSKTFLAIGLLASGLWSGCHNSQASVAQGAEPPPGEVWLTPAQVSEAKITVEEIGDQDVDDTILTSGKVTFEDIKVGHVYSPVTGRVVRIDAQLGQRVKKGDPLAVIQSPDVGTA